MSDFVNFVNAPGVVPSESTSLDRVVSDLLAKNITPVIRWLPVEARTAQAAAEQLDVRVGAIANSLVLLKDDDPLMVLVSGANQVDLNLVSHRVGSRVVLARGRQVRDITGQPIGGVAPLGHPKPIPTLIDSDIGRYCSVWASAGHPRSVFLSDLTTLATVTGGVVMDIAAR
ncbi:YbaK/EbsC family protein [Prescottella equi]